MRAHASNYILICCPLWVLYYYYVCYVYSSLTIYLLFTVAYVCNCNVYGIHSIHVQYTRIMCSSNSNNHEKIVGIEKVNKTSAHAFECVSVSFVSFKYAQCHSIFFLFISRKKNPNEIGNNSHKTPSIIVYTQFLYVFFLSCYCFMQ